MQRNGGDDDRREPALHVARPEAAHHAVGDVGNERVGAPPVAGRHRVGVAVEDEGRRAGRAELRVQVRPARRHDVQLVRDAGAREALHDALDDGCDVARRVRAGGGDELRQERLDLPGVDRRPCGRDGHTTSPSGTSSCTPEPCDEAPVRDGHGVGPADVQLGAQVERQLGGPLALYHRPVLLQDQHVELHPLIELLLGEVEVPGDHEVDRWSPRLRADRR